MKGLGLAAVLTAIVIGVLGSLVLEDLVQPRPQPSPTEPAHDPEYYFDDFRMTVMDAAGAPEYVLSGRHLVRFRDDQSSEIDAPRLAITRALQARWDAEAARGWLSPDGDLVRLRGAVVLERARFGERPPLRIETEALDIRTRERFAATDQPVTLRSPQWVVDSVGMTARLEEGLVDLLAEVRGRYQPGAAP